LTAIIKDELSQEEAFRDMSKIVKRAI